VTHGNVGAGAHGNTHMGQGGRVIDAVASHGDHRLPILEPLDLRRLLIGQYLGHHLVDAEGAAHRLGGCPMSAQINLFARAV
jgi:hypothetical protein